MSGRYLFFAIMFSFPGLILIQEMTMVPKIIGAVLIFIACGFCMMYGAALVEEIKVDEKK